MPQDLSLWKCLASFEEHLNNAASFVFRKMNGIEGKVRAREWHRF